ncbi:MAG: thiamine-phosphate kinase [Chitinophagales bacterium]|nr:thiamine-phosphate kinase [Bacteroidota bacterium]MCB9255659.1 thiamine-phosphate kinase [Chitinophagales bacterium]
MNEKHTPLSQLGEFALIKELTQDFKLQQESTIKGVGDDAAVMDYKDMQTVLSTDLLIEGIHFDLSYCPLKHLGYKAVVVNLSDIYAMNAEPKQITVSIAVSNRFSVEALKELYEGIKLACEFYQVDLVGGDTTSSLKGLIISVTAIGQGKKDELVYRNGAQVGDFICVSGDLGAAYMGLQLLNREKQVFLENPNMQPQLGEHQFLVGKQLKPEARKDIVAYLKEYNIKPSAMIDVSDGLSSELLHLCTQSNVGCLIYEANVPVHNDTYNQSLEFNIDPITCALSGGEDYELLFTLSPEEEAKLNTEEIDIAVIGKIVEKDKSCLLQSRANHLHKLTAQGWNSFKE